MASELPLVVLMKRSKCGMPLMAVRSIPTKVIPVQYILLHGPRMENGLLLVVMIIQFRSGEDHDYNAGSYLVLCSASGGKGKGRTRVNAEFRLAACEYYRAGNIAGESVSGKNESDHRLHWAP